jgi:hypothetical protein
MVRYLTISIADALGRCPKCMRTSFLAAISSLVVALAVTLITDFPFITSFAWTTAAVLIGLWIAHLVAFALRASAAARSVPNEVVDASLKVQHRSRREIVPMFCRALAFAALVTTLPSMIGPASAQSPCQNCQGCWNCCTCYQQVCTSSSGCDISCVNRCNDQWKECIKKC